MSELSDDVLTFLRVGHLSFERLDENLDFFAMIQVAQMVKDVVVEHKLEEVEGAETGRAVRRHVFDHLVAGKKIST